MTDTPTPSSPGGEPAKHAIDDLVDRFSAALRAKLHTAAGKYGYDHQPWMRDGWADECRTELRRHMAKGDPRDVAAYCAFLWHHGWTTTDAGDQGENDPNWDHLIAHVVDGAIHAHDAGLSFMNTPHENTFMREAMHNLVVQSNEIDRARRTKLKAAITERVTRRATELRPSDATTS